MASSSVLSSISSKLQNVERLLIDLADMQAAKTILLECRTNIVRIQSDISPQVFDSIYQSVIALLDICDSAPSTSAETDNRFSAVRDHNGRRGRPAVVISSDQLKLLHEKNFTVKQMAEIFKCSEQRVYRQLYASGIHQRDKYVPITEEQLEEKIRELHTAFPNSGSKMMHGYLRSAGINVQRRRVRACLCHIDPTGTASRWGRTVTRRTYRVAMPNSLWHLDSHMKLIRWGFATHGCVDGFSRMIVFLHCCTANTAEQVATSFVSACDTFGLPQRVRTDHGLENFHVGILMNILRGVNRGSIITGKSIHNQRIERMWRDVFKEVASTFYSEFYAMEDAGILDPENSVHRCSLQITYLQCINKKLTEFQDGWNKHGIRTENNRTPEQLWLGGILHNAHSTATDVFEQSLPVGERILQYLQQHNAALVTDETNSLNATHTGWHSELNLTKAQLDEVKASMSTTADNKTRYIECLDKLKEIVNV